ncbi:MAG: VWA domain-containing protein, partial [Thermoguttaceae bacterium]|nr:VWA domain-containing protein [Thermoguttaceae bacterium]
MREEGENNPIKSIFRMRKRRDFVSWCGSGVGSIILHALILLALFFVARAGAKSALPRGRQTDEIGIVFSDSDAAEAGGAGENAVPDASPATEAAAEIASELLEVADSLLPPDEGIGLTSSSVGAVLSAPSSGGDGGGPTPGDGKGDGQTVGFGDVRGSGRKFVYVLDRSDSMSWNGGAPMARAIAEAVASVESLDAKRGASKFQIVYFNHETAVFENGRALIDVNRENKARAVRFLKSIVPDGGTAPEDALKVAMKMRPDVVFFLTDADEELSEAS